MTVELSTLGSVIKTAYEAQSDTNAFTDALTAKLTGVVPFVPGDADQDITDTSDAPLVVTYAGSLSEERVLSIDETALPATGWRLLKAYNKSTGGFSISVLDDQDTEVCAIEPDWVAFLLLTSAGVELLLLAPVAVGAAGAVDAIGKDELAVGALGDQTATETVEDTDEILIKRGSAYFKITKSDFVSGLLASGGDEVITTIDGASHTLADDEKVDQHTTLVIDNSDAACAITIPKAITKGTWLVYSMSSADHTIDVEDDAGSVDGSAGGSATIKGAGRRVTIVVLSNAGEAPVVVTFGTARAVEVDGNVDFNSNEIQSAELASSCTLNLATNAELVSAQANNDLTVNPKFWSGTETEYAGLTPDAGTIYFVKADA